MMPTPLILLLCLVVAGVLVAGLVTMMRGQSAVLSQQLMRWRVGLQFVVIVFVLMIVWLNG